jgi:hypothetical protein
MSNVLCLRPQADFARVDALPPSTLAVTYKAPDDAEVPTLMSKAQALVIPAVGPKLSSELFQGTALKLVQVTRQGDVDSTPHSRRQRTRRQQQRGRRIRGDDGVADAAPLRLGRCRD